MSDSEKFVESNQAFAVNMAYASVTWLFSVLVFLPLARSFVVPDLVSLVAVILLAFFSYFFFIAVHYSGPLMEHVSSRISSWYIFWRKVDDDERPVVWKRVRKALGVGITLLVYLAHGPLLRAVNPVFAGIGLIFTLLRIIILLT